jgi:hypothetical protein
MIKDGKEDNWWLNSLEDPEAKEVFTMGLEGFLKQANEPIQPIICMRESSLGSGGRMSAGWLFEWEHIDEL